MALHGNKSQSARTQALEGFKTGQIRALVATDIAARGIDIDDLPHVVNYEIPNIPEDYVHRIGRTGRAGREGQAVSLVCMDEEGFMMEIERFTKQEIPVQVLEGFGPEEGEKAEPIAMGRQTLWGGAGKPPSRDVMQAAAKAARQEMMDRIRTNKATPRAGKGGASGGDKPARGDGERGERPERSQRAQPGQRPPHAAGPRQGQNTNPGANANRNRRPPNRGPRPQGSERDDDYDDHRQPRADAHLGTQFGSHQPPRRNSQASQPDPMRTSVDSMAGRNHRSGGPRRSGGGGGNFGGGRGGYGR